MATAQLPTPPAQAVMPALLAHKESESAKLRVNQLCRAPEYARPLRPHKVAGLARDWKDKWAGVLLISAREDGTLRMMTGNHRWASLKLKGQDEYLLDCLVYYGLTVKEESDIYLAQDKGQLHHSVVDDFPAMVEAGDPVALGIKKVLTDLGLEITPQSGAGWAANRVRAVGGLFRAVEMAGLDNLRVALGLIRDEWAPYVSKTSHTRRSAYAETSVVPLAVLLRLYLDGRSPLTLPKLRESMRREKLEGYEAKYTRHRVASTSSPGAGISVLYGVLAYIDVFNYNRRDPYRLNDVPARQGASARFGLARPASPYHTPVGAKQQTAAKHFIDSLPGAAG